tara:strand:+ start:70 stop:333 length:264 start_codon:yes stop_codon:yes gene_type:complete
MGRKRKERFDSGGMYFNKNDSKAASKIDRATAKAEKTELKIRLADAKSRKRKWLAAILVLGIAIYFIVSGSGLSVLNTIKGFLPTGE